MQTLGSADGLKSIETRIGALTATDQRRWGTMSVDGMICHLSDSYKLALGERTVSMAAEFRHRRLIKWIALWTPLKWPKGTPTRPEVQQGVGGTAPVDFEQDRRHLLALVNRFSSGLDVSIPHPFFGRLTRSEWLRWGYLHADHHLRQFGR